MELLLLSYKPHELKMEYCLIKLGQISCFNKPNNYPSNYCVSNKTSSSNARWQLQTHMSKKKVSLEVVTLNIEKYMIPRTKDNKSAKEI